MWAKGPDFINNLLGVLIRFREDLVAFTGDIKRMYHSIYISELDQHTHRFLWRNLETNRNTDTFVMLVLSFGDRPASTIAAMGDQKTALMHKMSRPSSCQTLMKNIYVDDIIDSVHSS